MMNAFMYYFVMNNTYKLYSLWEINRTYSCDCEKLLEPEKKHEISTHQHCNVSLLRLGYESNKQSVKHFFKNIFYFVSSLLALFSLYYFVSVHAFSEEVWIFTRRLFFYQEEDMVDWKQRRTEVEKYCQVQRLNSSEQLSEVIF